MFENALIESERTRGPRGRLLTLPVAAAIHAVALATLMVAQLWAVEEVPEPEQRIAVYLEPAAPAPPPPPPPPPPLPGDVPTPVEPQRETQPGSIPPTIPTTPTDPGGGVAGGVPGGVPGGDIGGTVGGVVGGVPGPTPAPTPEIEGPVILKSYMEAPVRTGGPDPTYPEAARKARREGVVILEAVVERDGAVGAVRLLRDGVGFGAGEAALAAVRHWHYRPARFNDRPLAVIMFVTVRFTLN